jgi:hypothetical protein
MHQAVTPLLLHFPPFLSCASNPTPATNKTITSIMTTSGATHLLEIRTELIVLFAFLFITQHLIRVIDFAEFFLGLFIIFVSIGMILTRQLCTVIHTFTVTHESITHTRIDRWLRFPSDSAYLVVGLFDIALRSVSLDAEHGIMILLLRGVKGRGAMKLPHLCIEMDAATKKCARLEGSARRQVQHAEIHAVSMRA